MDILAQLPLISPIIVLAVSSLILLMYGAFTNDGRGTAILAVLAYGTAAVSQLPGAATVWGASQALFASPTGPLLVLSPFTLVAGLLLLGLAVIATPLATTYFNTLASATGTYLPNRHKPEYYVLSVLSVTGMLILLNASDFLSFYMGLELMSFTVYIMVAFLRNDAKSSEAGLKYFVLGGLASGLFLYGISLLFAALGTTGFAGIHAALQANTSLMQQPAVLVGLALTLAGTLFKLSAVPLHMWTPDVYEGAPTPVTAFMSILPKLAAGVVLVRMLGLPFLSLADLWQPLIAAAACLSMLLGSVMAILQTNLKRLLAWSTIANVGFILVGIIAPGQAGNGAVLTYLVIYALTTVGLFASVLAAGLLTTADLRGLGARRPGLALAFGVCLFSLAGIPPLAGFIAKFGVFAAAVAAGFTWLAVVGVLCSAIACFYSLWLIKLMAFDTPAELSESTTLVDVTTVHEGRTLTILAAVVAVALLLLGILPGLLSALILPAAGHLY